MSEQRIRPHDLIRRMKPRPARTAWNSAAYGYYLYSFIGWTLRICPIQLEARA